jgi:hypothetical protein
MRRLIGIVALALLGGGGFLVGRGVIKPSFRADAEPVAGGTLYEETAPCPGCPINLTSAEVQRRKGGTLFLFEGRWPAAPADIGADLRLEANGIPLTLHPTARGFEIAEGEVNPLQVAVGMREGRLLLNLTTAVLKAPVTFAFGLWDGEAFTARIPRRGALEWTGRGAPRLLKDGKTGAEPETPESFLQDLAAAFQAGDDAFLLQRLHPIVLAVYAEETCASYVAGLADPTRAYEVVSVGEPEPFVYRADGHTSTIPDAITVEVEATIDGESAPGEVHVAPGPDGALAWFTDCGQPKPLP